MLSVEGKGMGKEKGEERGREWERGWEREREGGRKRKEIHAETCGVVDRPLRVRWGGFLRLRYVSLFLNRLLDLVCVELV